MVKNAMELINKISDKKEKDIFIKRIAEKTGINQELLIKEAFKNEMQIAPKMGKERQQLNINSDLVEMHLIQLLLEYPQKVTQIENENILDFFLQPELKVLGEKIVEAYKLLGFVDINIILSADEDKPLLERIYKLRMEAASVHDDLVEKIFADNIRQIKKKWYKEQHHQIKLQLGKAQDNGDEELLSNLLREKEKLLTKEKELH